jgi:hypothetical protein
MDWTAEHQPATYFAVCSRLIGPEVKVTIEQSLPGNLSPTDWADLRELLSAIQSALPDAADRSPGEVFRYALDVLTGKESLTGQLEPIGHSEPNGRAMSSRAMSSDVPK